MYSMPKCLLVGNNMVNLHTGLRKHFGFPLVPHVAGSLSVTFHILQRWKCHSCYRITVWLLHVFHCQFNRLQWGVIVLVKTMAPCQHSFPSSFVPLISKVTHRLWNSGLTLQVPTPSQRRPSQLFLAQNFPTVKSARYAQAHKRSLSKSRARHRTKSPTSSRYTSHPVITARCRKHVTTTTVNKRPKLCHHSFTGEHQPTKQTDLSTTRSALQRVKQLWLSIWKVLLSCTCHVHRHRWRQWCCFRCGGFHCRGIGVAPNKQQGLFVGGRVFFSTSCHQQWECGGCCRSSSTHGWTAWCGHRFIRGWKGCCSLLQPPQQTWLHGNEVKLP